MSTDASDSRAGDPGVPEPALVLNGVSKRLNGRSALADVSLTVVRGRVHGLVGPNGSGKTTLLRILAGLWKADSGVVERPDNTINRIGYVSQRFCLYEELTVHENLLFQARMRDCDVRSVAAAEADLDLVALRNRRASSLSGGQRQRLLIAAALLHQPTLLLLDEPTTALDAEGRRDLWELMRSEADAGAAVVLTTHEHADVQSCDVVTRLHDGRVVAAEPRSGAAAA